MVAGPNPRLELTPTAPILTPTLTPTGLNRSEAQRHSLRSRFGAPGRNRTCDKRFRKPLLYPLSYEGLKAAPSLILRHPGIACANAVASSLLQAPAWRPPVGDQRPRVQIRLPAWHSRAG